MTKTITNKKIKVTFKSKIKPAKKAKRVATAVKPKVKAKNKKLTITKARPMKPRQTKKDIVLNVPTTKEQQAGIPAVVSGNNFEGVNRIDHLPLSKQIDAVFNPLHSITKTTVSDAVSDATFIVPPTPVAQG